MNIRTIIAIVLFVALWGIAPWYHRWAGHPDESAWVQLFMAPSGIVGIIICVVNFKKKNKYMLVAIYAILTIHLLIGLGFHPK